MSEPINPTQPAAPWVSCEHSLGLLVDYLDGTLPEDEKRALDRHFKACPPCIDFVRKYRLTPDLCKNALADEMPHEMCDRLHSFLADKLK